MKKLILKTLKNKLFISFTINFLIMVLCIYVSSFSYDNYKDFINSLLISKHHIAYNNDINFILSFAVSNIQYLFQNINCFVLFQSLFAYLAFSSLTYALIDKFGLHKGIIFSLLINILFCMNHYADMATQKTSALLLAAGFILILNAIRRKRYRFICMLGIIEIIIGSFYCYEYFFIALMFASVYFLADLFAKDKHKIKFRKFIWYFRPFLILYVLVTFFSITAHHYSVNVNNETQYWKNNYEYYELTDKISNSPYPDYNENKEALNKAGIYETEYELLKNGYYDATTPINLDGLRLISSLQEQNNQKNIFYEANGFFSDSFESLINFDTNAIIMIVTIILSALYLVFHKKSHCFFPIFLLISSVILNITLRYFYNSYNYTLYGTILIPLCLLIYSVDFESLKEFFEKELKKRQKSVFFVSLGIIALLVTGYSIVYNVHSTYDENLKKRPSALYTEVERHPERYYILDPYTAKDYIQYSTNYLHPLWGFKDNYLKNVDSFGYHHRTKELRKRGTDNIYYAAINAKRTYIIDNSITYKKENYLKKYYSTEEKTNYSYNFDKEVCGYRIYQIS